MNEELWKNFDWSWLASFMGRIIKEMKTNGLSEDEIIEELKKYGEVKVVCEDDVNISLDNHLSK